MKQYKVTHKSILKTNRSVSVDDILAAGGATAFGIKSGKNNQTIINALEKSQKPEPFTDEEWGNLLEQLANDK